MSQTNEIKDPHDASSADRGTSENVSVRLMQNEADIEATWPLYESFHRETRYRKLQVAREKRTAYLRDNVLGKPDRHAMIIAELREETVGFLSCTANRLLYHDEMIASCMAFYVLPELRKGLLGGRIAMKLLDAYRRWAINRNAIEIQIHVTSGIGMSRTDSFLRKAGYHQVGGNYSADLSSKGDAP